MSDQRKLQIYHTIKLVPEGKVASYAQIADLAGLPRRARLVGYYLKQLESTNTIPWHRVIKSNGEIAFPNDSEMAKKQCQYLLSEGVSVTNFRINMKKYQWMPEIVDILYNLKF
ncbi:MGMT family protein [Alteromonas ponticola]|uniref:MGMT family protein n=1 Tax=Alteromonas aquimaris TaxID=2998417 RepID=A0ABT3P803_9ALTE|nr:MGMT family protein [Alteromonas aquimaris]MCW8108895.1 MGMT family protein [Alteromonas aquimaris]